MPNIGYWNADSDASDAYLVDEITTNGHTAVSLPGITISSLSGLDALYLVNYDNDGWNLSAAQIAALDVAVSNGMSLVVFDRNVTGAGDILPGSDGIVFVRDVDSVGQYDVDVANGAPDSFINAVETITDDMFDGGDSSNHGYVTVSSLPNGADVLLTTGVEGNAVAVAYKHGQGNVFYSTIPLDHYSNGPTKAITQAEVAVLAGSAINHALGREPAFDHATTVDLFATRSGEVAFMSELALAAYHLDLANGHELDVDGSNIWKIHSEQAYEALPVGFELFDAGDLPGVPLHINPTNADVDAFGNFPMNGLDNGIYTSENAAALVGRSEDSIFIAFRGTNDNNGSITPDVFNWYAIEQHFREYAPLFEALQTYLNDDANDSIKKIYVTGHSLGGAMVQAFIETYGDEFAGTSVEGVTFASPGYPRDSRLPDDFPHPVFTESGLSNLRVSGDKVPWANADVINDVPFVDVSDRLTYGDVTTIKHNLPAGTDLHSMRLYRDFVLFFDDQKIRSTYQNNTDYETIITHVQVIEPGNFLMGAANDVIYGGSGWEIILGGDGNDVINGQKGNDFIKGGNDNDTIWGANGLDYVEGGSGNDTIKGGKKKDELHGGIGDDVMYGEVGEDDIFGDAGNDIIWGGDDNDTINAGINHDTVYGGEGEDTIKGDWGQDTIYGGDGIDVINGNQKDDLIYGDDGNDFLYAGSGEDVVFGGDDKDRILGGADNDRLYGGNQDDIIYGNGSDDTIKGGDGKDTIYGGDGEDTIYGNKKHDVMYGGADKDTFVFNSVAETASTGFFLQTPMSLRISVWVASMMS